MEGGGADRICTGDNPPPSCREAMRVRDSMPPIRRYRVPESVRPSRPRAYQSLARREIPRMARITRGVRSVRIPEPTPPAVLADVVVRSASDILPAGLWSAVITGSGGLGCHHSAKSDTACANAENPSQQAELASFLARSLARESRSAFTFEPLPQVTPNGSLDRFARASEHVTAPPSMRFSWPFRHA